MGPVIGLLGLAVMVVAILALVKGGLPKFMIHTRRTAWIALVVGFVLLMVGGALSPKQEPRPQATEQASTPSQPAPSSQPQPQAAPQATAPTTPETSQPQTTSPSTSGSAAQDDGTNDVADGNGRKPPSRLAGMDLVSVTLETTNSNLNIRYRTSTAFPSSTPPGTSALWNVIAWSADGSRRYYLGAKLIESEWKVYIFDAIAGKNIYVGSPLVSGEFLIVNFPLDQLPGLMPRFKWRATSEWDGTWQDNVPNTGDKPFPLPYSHKGTSQKVYPVRP